MREVEIRFSSKEQNEKKKKETRIPCEKFQRRVCCSSPAVREK